MGSVVCGEEHIARTIAVKVGRWSWRKTEVMLIYLTMAIDIVIVVLFMITAVADKNKSSKSILIAIVVAFMANMYALYTLARFCLSTIGKLPTV